MGLSMNAFTRVVIGLVIVLVATLTVAETVGAASRIGPDMTGVTIGVIVAVIAIIITLFFVAGGIKYVTPENVLDTEIRKNLYEYLDECPGSHLREIARELNLKPSNAAWHLRKLEQTNLVRSRMIGGKKVFYLVEGGIEVRKLAIAESILRNENAKNIMQYLNDHPGKHLLEIAHALDLNHHVVKWHLKKMHMAELIEGDTSHSVYPVYYPTEVGAEALESFNNYTGRMIKVTA
ncbi:MAG: winged helix-turn-helix transcriptional regulator [Methanobacteriota archaeon]